MEQNDSIEVLITRYLEGTSSLQEEAVLRRFFERGPVPPEWRVYEAMFRHFAGERKGLRRGVWRRRLLPLLGYAAAVCVLLFWGLKLGSTDVFLPEANTPIYIGIAGGNLEGESGTLPEADIPIYIGTGEWAVRGLDWAPRVAQSCIYIGGARFSDLDLIREETLYALAYLPGRESAGGASPIEALSVFLDGNCFIF